MSCNECEQAQAKACETGMVSYYRWKNANIMVVGCNTHVREVFNVLNKAQEEGL